MTKTIRILSRSGKYIRCNPNKDERPVKASDLLRTIQHHILIKKRVLCSADGKHCRSEKTCTLLKLRACKHMYHCRNRNQRNACGHAWGYPPVAHGHCQGTAVGKGGWIDKAHMHYLKDDITLKNACSFE